MLFYDIKTMKRKLIKQGGGGLVFYVPSTWIKERNLKAGNEINLEESGDYLILSSESKETKEITISLEEKEYIPSAITHLYRLGYDKIIIKTNKINYIEKEVLPLLLGFEVTEKKSDKITIENISVPEEEKFEPMLRRIFLIIKSMSEKLGSNLKEEKINLDRLTFYCKRIITKKQVSFSKPLIYWELLTYLLAIGHGYFYLNESLKNNKINKEYLEKVNNYYQKLYNAFYLKDKKLIVEMNKEKQDLVFNLPEKLIKTNPIIMKMQYTARMIQLCTGSVYYLIVEQ